MKYIRCISLIICMILLVPSMAIAEENTNEKAIVLIDAGHGGIDGGAKSKNGTVEKTINLSIALKLKAALEEEGYKVFLTRDSDKELSSNKVQDLTMRCDMKRDTKCNIFISIHQNKFPKSNCYGAQVWYADNDVSQKLANSLQTSLKANVDSTNKRLEKCAKKQYKILRDNYEGASVIVECGFISNKIEEQKLSSEVYQEKLVKGLVKGVNEYIK